MKRIPFVAGLALAAVLVTVTILVRPTLATSEPVYCSCGSAGAYINQKYQECMSQPGAPTFGSHCYDPSDGNPGSYHYSCSWGP